MAVLRVLTHQGDQSVEYDADVDDGRLARARALFDARVGKGYLAFVPEAKTGGTQIRRFDPRASEIILQPAISGG